MNETIRLFAMLTFLFLMQLKTEVHGQTNIEPSIDTFEYAIITSNAINLNIEYGSGVIEEIKIDKGTNVRVLLAKELEVLSKKGWEVVDITSNFGILLKRKK